MSKKKIKDRVQMQQMIFFLILTSLRPVRPFFANKTAPFSLNGPKGLRGGEKYFIR